jgi:hypothetical protein
MFFNLLAALFSLGQYLFYIVNDGAKLKGDFLCHGMYYVAAVMYKPLTLNMMWLLTVCTTYALTHIFYDKSPRKHHRRNGLGTPHMAPVPRNRFTIAMIAIVSTAYMAWFVTAAVVVGPMILVFSVVLLIPALALPVAAMHYVPMLATRAVEGVEFALGIGQHCLQVGDAVEVVEDPGVSDASRRKPALACVTHVHSGWLYRLFREDLYDVELTDEKVVYSWVQKVRGCIVQS